MMVRHETGSYKFRVTLQYDRHQPEWMDVLKLKGENGEQIQADACGADGGGRRHRRKIIVKMVILNAD